MKLFLDRDFIIQFKNELFNNKISDNYSKVISIIYNDIFKKYDNICLYTNLSSDDFGDKEIFYIIKNLLSFNPETKSEDDFIDALKNVPLFEIFVAFSDNNPKWEKSFEELGGLFFNSSNYKERISKYISFEMEIYFNNNKVNFNWNIIGKVIKLNTKDIILIDNYLLKDSEVRKKNLFPIIDEVGTYAKEIMQELNLIIISVPNELLNKKNKKKFELEERNKWSSIENEINNYIVKKNYRIFFELIPYFKYKSKFDLHK